jgi:16S rRNA (cytosine967-C5)-methyltransferase
LNRGLTLSLNPRLVAFLVLKETATGRHPEETLAEQGQLLPQRDQNLAAALTYETLRHQSFLDWVLQSRLTIGRTGSNLRLVLRLGLTQLLYFDRLKEHAAVSETVALAKDLLPGRAGLVNAVLRSLLRTRAAGHPWPPKPTLSGNPAKDLALNHSYPSWLVLNLLHRFTPNETEEILVAGNRPTPPTLRLSPGPVDRETFSRTLPFDTRPTLFSPWGLTALKFAGRPENWPGFAEGRFTVQDEASQLLGLLTGSLAPGSKVLDACCGLGGKTLLLAALNPTALIIARDKDPTKLERLQVEAGRLGLTNIQTERGDSLAERPENTATYDLVLVDAPCSGLGVIRRRPDLKWNKSTTDLSRLAALQFTLLTAASRTVKPGGRLIYGVCSFSEAEGPEVAKKFHSNQPDFRPAPTEAWPESLRPHLGPGPSLTLWPHRHQTDGFFWAIWHRLSPA